MRKRHRKNAGGKKTDRFAHLPRETAEPTHDINERFTAEDGAVFMLRSALEGDMTDLKDLYFRVYEGKYTLPEICNPDKMKWAIHDPNYLWLIARKGEKLIGSVIFLIDKRHRLSKCFAGAVLPESRGYKIMKRLMERGIRYIFNEKNYCDLIYGIVRTFVTLSFHGDLKELGFIDTGIFPNVRKVSEYETHSLKLLFRESTLNQRLQPPNIIPQATELFNIVKERLGLEPAIIADYRYRTPENLEKLEYIVEKSDEIEWEYYEKRDSGQLILSFYPFHYPGIKLRTPDNGTQIFIHFEERDGHADLMGIQTETPEKLTEILSSLAPACENIGIKYLEMLVNAYQPDLQKKIYEADFLPCAYMPGFITGTDGRRLDFMMVSRTFVPLNFKGIKLTDDNRPLVRAYYRVMTTKLWEDLEHA